MAKLPAFQFYPGDWMKDPAVRAVSHAARGLWIDMLCLMHESSRRGYLQQVSGKPVSPDQLARMTGGAAEEVSRLLQELYDSGAYSCTDNGTIYNRRMVKEEKTRAIDRDRKQRNRENGVTSNGTEGEGELALVPDWVPKKPWKDFVEMRERIRKPLTQNAIELLVNKLDKLREAGSPPGDVLNQSVIGSYQGVFELKGDKKKLAAYSENIIYEDPLQSCLSGGCRVRFKLGEGKGTDGMYCSEKCEQACRAGRK